ncbi:MAG: hypothetical protein U9R74_15180 [Pseudomonadota bacterium]|nr:hypothetical protein [Pseudomonadota bacterium]
MALDTQTLRDTVQHNCDISDARHASDYTLCIYLLKMRELFRWEKGLGFENHFPKEEIGSWLTEREQRWENLENEEFRRIAISGSQLDPFDTNAVNDRLLGEGFVYSGGIGRRGAPHFFLARLERQIDHDDYRILVAGKELARDLTSPPAMTLGKTIYVRQESLTRMIWERFQEWRWHQYENAMQRALSYYDFDNDIPGALGAMMETEIEPVVQHEVGEVQAGALLGDQWKVMVMAASRSRAEIMARAVRDHLADTLTTLPALLDSGAEASLHFYMANLTAMRKDLFPGFGIAYDEWASGGGLDAMREVVEAGRAHWLETALGMLDIHEAHGGDPQRPLERYVESRRLTM